MENLESNCCMYDKDRNRDDTVKQRRILNLPNEIVMRLQGKTCHVFDSAFSIWHGNISLLGRSVKVINVYLFMSFSDTAEH